MKNNCLFLLILVVIVATGCSVAGSSNRPVEDDSVTLLATVSAPQIAATGLLAAVGQENNSDAFSRFIASSTCKVNGAQVEFSLSSGTRELKVEKILPSSSYKLELNCGKFSLKGIVGHSSRRITLPMGLSLRSTAEFHLRDAVARLESLTIDQLNNYEVAATLLDSVTSTLGEELKKSFSTAASYETKVTDSVSAAVAGKSFADCLKKSGSALIFNGDYSGKIFYYALNGSGQPVLAVQAIASMTFSQSGSTVTGSCNLSPLAVMPLVPEPGISAPGKTAFSFTGTVGNSLLSFTRKGANNGSPLSGKDIDSWFIFPVREGLAVRASNLDKSYYTGIQSRAGEFVLIKK